MRVQILKYIFSLYVYEYALLKVVICLQFRIFNANKLFLVPTNSLVIKDKDNKTLSGTIGPYREGSSLILICEAQGGKKKYFHKYLPIYLHRV